MSHRWNEYGVPTSPLAANVSLKFATSETETAAVHDPSVVEGFAKYWALNQSSTRAVLDHLDVGSVHRARVQPPARQPPASSFNLLYSQSVTASSYAPTSPRVPPPERDPLPARSPTHRRLGSEHGTIVESPFGVYVR